MIALGGRERILQVHSRGKPVSWANLVEVEYRVWRRHGGEEAQIVLCSLRELVEEELPGVSRMRSVAALESEHSIALADCFAIATAAARNATLITGDPEIIQRAERLPCAVSDARRD